MVTRAVIADAWIRLALCASMVIVPSVVLADARIVVRTPTCAAAHLDLALLDELVSLELDDAAGDAIEIEIGAAICDASAAAVEIVVREETSGREQRDQIELVLDPDPESHTRAVALAIAERAHLHLGRRSPAEPDDRAPTDRQAPPAIESRAREDLIAPFAPPGYAPALQTPTVLSRATVFTITSEIVVRMLPVHPSWAIGTRVRARAYLDQTLWLEGGLIVTWSRASVRNEGDVDAVVGAGLGALGVSLIREPWIALSAAARVELGLLYAMGWASFGIGGSTSAHPWATAGLAADLALPITPELSVIADVGASAIVLGTRVSTTTGTQIDLSYVTLDLSAGLRVVVP